MWEYTFRLGLVDLRSGETTLTTIPPEILRKYLGGSGLGAYLLSEHLSKELPPLSEDAPFLILTGPLTGTAGPAVGRYVICAKSPATGLWGESNVGGFFGPELRKAGYDGLLLTGKSDQAIYLWIQDGKVEIRSASHLWGQTDTYETQARIKEELGDRNIRVACIGSAGEHMLPFSVVLCDHGRVAGRTGMGAVMGSKGLKAIAVRGRQPIPLMERERFNHVRREANIALKDDNFSRVTRAAGTASGLDYWAYLGEMPARYFTSGVFEGAENVSGNIIAETILSRVSACHGCVIGCGRVVKLEDGIERKGPEYETTVGFGPNLGIDDIAAITLLGEMCDRYGMDTISLSNTIGLAFHLYQEGILSESDTDGEGLNWGDAEVVKRLVDRTAQQEGFGELLALGARGLAAHFGVLEKAIQVNGLEIAYHDPRAASGMALVYATSPRGACHNQSDYFLVDSFGHTNEDLDIRLYSRHDGVEKVANIARHQDWRTLCNNLVLCNFSNVEPATVLELINRATGFQYALDELILLGERCWNLKRIINHSLGITAENDRLPPPLLEPLLEGGTEGYVPPFDDMLDAYYRVRAWDPTTGRPMEGRLRKLSLETFIPELWADKRTNQEKP
jgi:aldehyde:ferredoxin oxidoreductase